MRIIILLILLLSFTSLASAELYLIINSQSKEIFTASEKNDTVIPQGCELVTLPGGFANYDLADNPINYKYQGGKFKLNQAKIDADTQAQELNIEINAEADLIKAKMADMAVAELKANGQTFKHEAAAKERAK